MASKGTGKSSYNPYAIKSIVGKTSMKELAAKAAANVVLEKAKEAKPVSEDLPVVLDINNDDDDAIVVIGSDEEDALCEFNPPSSSSRSRRHRAEIVLLENSSHIKKNNSSRKKRLNKAEKNALALKNESLKTRAALIAALKNANEETEIVLSEPKLATPLFVPVEEEKELIFVLWRKEKHKFFLRKDEKFAVVFEKISAEMKTEPKKVLIFCNSNPSKIVQPLDCLNDVGQERMFLSAHRKEQPTGGALVENEVPEGYQLVLNVQVDASKLRTKVTTDKRETLQAFMEKYARMVGKKAEDFVFSFDGDRLDPTKTADTYDLEGEEVIDARTV